MALAVRGEHVDGPVRRIRPDRSRAICLVVAGRRVVLQVRVNRSRVAILGPSREIHIEPGHLADLLLKSDAALPVVRRLEIGRDRPHRLRRNLHLAGKNIRRREAVGRVGNEIGTAVVDKLRRHELAV